jgi:hypothetical protein
VSVLSTLPSGPAVQSPAGLPAGGLEQLDLLFQPGERDHPQQRTPPGVPAAAARTAGRTQGGQVLGRLLFQQRPEHALRIDRNTRRKLGKRPRSADGIPRRRRHGGRDQVGQSLPVRLGTASLAAALAAQGHGCGRPQRVGPDAIVADLRRGAERGVARAGLGLSQGDLGQVAVAILRIVRLLGQGHGRGEFTRRNLGPDQGIVGVCCDSGRGKSDGPEADGCHQQPFGAHAMT